MAKKSRLARWITPRFGLRWVFVGMLFLISAAGWWKFHRDLYVEEVAAIEGLLRSGAKVSAQRIDLPNFFPGADKPDLRVPWNAPLLEPFYVIQVDGDPSVEVRDAVLKLPGLRTYRESVLPYREYSRTENGDDNAAIETLLGRPLPALPEAKLSLDVLDEPLPEGTEVEAAEAENIAEQIRTAWRNPDANPPRRLVVSDTTTLGGTPSIGSGDPVRVDLFDAERGFRHTRDRDDGAEDVWLAIDDSTFGHVRLKNGWKRHIHRVAKAGERAESRVFRVYADEDYPYAAADFSDYSVGRRLRESDEPYRFERIARIDDVRYRVDFLPFEIPPEKIGKMLVMGTISDVDEMSCVLRSDLDWVPEASRIVDASPPGGTSAWRRERTLVQRFRRTGGFVTIEERLTRDTEATGAVAGAIGNRGTLRTLYVTELDPQFDERIFDPKTLDPEPWPARRELPWLRWYRVTFLLACGLTILSIGQRFWPRRATPTEDAGDPQDGS